MDQKMAHRYNATGYFDWRQFRLASSIESVFGPVLFLNYIDDIDLNIRDMLKCADNTKVICPIENEEYGETLQADLDRLWIGQINGRCSLI